MQKCLILLGILLIVRELSQNDFRPKIVYYIILRLNYLYYIVYSYLSLSLRRLRYLQGRIQLILLIIGNRYYTESLSSDSFLIALLLILILSASSILLLSLLSLINSSIYLGSTTFLLLSALVLSSRLKVDSYRDSSLVSLLLILNFNK